MRCLMTKDFRLFAVSETIFQDGYDEAITHFGSEDAFEEFIDRYIWNRNNDDPELHVFDRAIQDGWNKYKQDLDKEIQNDYADLPYN